MMYKLHKWYLQSWKIWDTCLRSCIAAICRKISKRQKSFRIKPCIRPRRLSFRQIFQFFRQTKKSAEPSRCLGFESRTPTVVFFFTGNDFCVFFIYEQLVCGDRRSFNLTQDLNICTSLESRWSRHQQKFEELNLSKWQTIGRRQRLHHRRRHRRRQRQF